jgi:REP element-mobilizing transposase RayT
MRAMPGKNIYKDFVADSYYHIYNRGVDRQTIFRENDDYIVFLSLLKRYLSKKVSVNAVGVPYPSYGDRLELLAFCLMPNHFHLLIYQHDKDAMTLLLRSVCTAYGMYFNKKYNRVGPLFQQRYKASRIYREDYLLHISRYIHLNPEDFEHWQWSSLSYYTGKYRSDWVSPQRILDLFGDDYKDYKEFLDSYKDRRDELEEIKHELAHL